MATKIATTAQLILEKAGGANNVVTLTHCATRLRFQLADQSKVDKDAIDADPDVLGVVLQGTNGLQVIMGGGVADYYHEIMQLPGMANKAGASESEAAAPQEEKATGWRGRVDYCFEFLSDTFRPVLWALLGASLIITLLVLADTFGIQDFRAENQPPSFQFMHAMWKSVFYFLPIMVGATAARKLGANEFVGAAIPAALLTPQFLSLGSAGDTIHVFGLPMILNDYSGQVFPPMIAAIGLYWVEKGLKKIIPTAVHMVFVPFISLLIMIPLTAFLLGPFGIGIGNGISALLSAVNNFSPFVLCILIPLLYPFLVPLGLHWPLNAIMIQNIATMGYDFIQGPMGAWNFAAFGLSAGVLAVSIREKNSQMRQMTIGSTMAGLLGGISEPTIYGVLLRFKRTYPPLLAGCFSGGLVMALWGTITGNSIIANAFVFTSLLTIPAMTPMAGYALGILVAFLVTFFWVFFFDYRSKEEKAAVLAQIRGEAPAAAAEEEPQAEEKAESPADAAPKAPKPAFVPGAQIEIASPLEGQAVAIEEIPDPAFASGALGKGVAIWPTTNTVVAPADATVLAVQSSGHAVGLALDSGIQMLIHVGIDTVQMNGDGFTVHVERKQKVKKGDLLITFDPEKIKAAGYPLVTPVLVSNTKKFGNVEGFPAEHVKQGDHIITTTAKSE
ncbi:MAG: glucose PTS transporter subunit IIA [Corynebacterium sp.]|nr:glucose PTS transporter subunit IIA [Corynebacterium sp.]